MEELQNLSAIEELKEERRIITSRWNNFDVTFLCDSLSNDDIKIKKEIKKYEIQTVKDLKEALNDFDENLKIGLINYDADFVEIKNIKLSTFEDRYKEYYMYNNFKDNIIELDVQKLDLQKDYNPAEEE